MNVLDIACSLNPNLLYSVLISDLIFLFFGGILLFSLSDFIPVWVVCGGDKEGKKRRKKKSYGVFYWRWIASCSRYWNAFQFFCGWPLVHFSYTVLLVFTLKTNAFEFVDCLFLSLILKDKKVCMYMSVRWWCTEQTVISRPAKFERGISLNIVWYCI